MKFGPTAQISFETHVFGRVQLEILSHVRDSHAILLMEFPPLASLVCGGNSRLYADAVTYVVPSCNASFEAGNTYCWCDWFLLSPLLSSCCHNTHCSVLLFWGYHILQTIYDLLDGPGFRCSYLIFTCVSISIAESLRMIAQTPHRWVRL